MEEYDFDNMSKEDIARELEWSDQWEFGTPYGKWAFKKINDLKASNDLAIEKLKLLLNDLQLNVKTEKETGKSYFNNELFSIRVKEILKIIKKGGE